MSGFGNRSRFASSMTLPLKSTTALIQTKAQGTATNRLFRLAKLTYLVLFSTLLWDQVPSLTITRACVVISDYIHLCQCRQLQAAGHQLAPLWSLGLEGLDRPTPLPRFPLLQPWLFEFQGPVGATRIWWYLILTPHSGWTQ